jgi:8-hydroxy-5-deazaflavin:NADPH oxidoreductase
MTNVTIIGTGNVGGNLGTRFAKSGIPVRFGVRPGADTTELLARSKGADVAALDVAEAVTWADAVFLAIPANAALELARGLGNKLVVDCTNPLTWSDGPVWAPTPEGSMAASIAKAAPTARVVKAFNTFGAEFHADPANAQVFMAGDDASAKATVAELATRAGFRPVDAGPLRNAAVLENLAMLWIHMATVGGHGRNFTFAMQDRA